ncbi:hypothetical protein ACFL2V_13900 [Pseudomonadota bacterium]
MLKFSLIVKKTLILLCVIGLSACSTPGHKLDLFAQESGFERGVVTGKKFQHVSYQRTNGSKRLHIYLEGDGIPWWLRVIIAKNPTGRYGLGLRMMALDNNDSFYLARPCYNGFYDTEPCNNTLWTGRRYSNAVVSSMHAVLEKYLEENDYEEVVLIGHSGGGTLAMLLAQRLKDITAVLTIAANMDIDAWTELHGYTQLQGSINPAAQPSLPANIWQLHLAGKKDKNVPPSIIHGALRNQINANTLTFSDYNHHCCWLDIWPEILKALESRELNALRRKYATL